MNKQELKASLEKLLEQLEETENNVNDYFFSIFDKDQNNWSQKQCNEFEKTMCSVWEAGENLASAIHSLE